METINAGLSASNPVTRRGKNEMSDQRQALIYRVFRPEETEWLIIGYLLLIYRRLNSAIAFPDTTPLHFAFCASVDINFKHQEDNASRKWGGGVRPDSRYVAGIRKALADALSAAGLSFRELGCRISAVNVGGSSWCSSHFKTCGFLTVS